MGGCLPRSDRALAPTEPLVPIEVPDENEGSGFRVVPAIDLTEDDQLNLLIDQYTSFAHVFYCGIQEPRECRPTLLVS